MAKTEVYSWRVTPAVKAALEERARARGMSLAALLEQITETWLADSGTGEERDDQRRLHRAARAYVGAIRGGDPTRASRARQLVRVRARRRVSR